MNTDCHIAQRKEWALFIPGKSYELNNMTAVSSSLHKHSRQGEKDGWCVLLLAASLLTHRGSQLRIEGLLPPHNVCIWGSFVWRKLQEEEVALRKSKGSPRIVGNSMEKLCREVKRANCIFSCCNTYSSYNIWTVSGLFQLFLAPFPNPALLFLRKSGMISLHFPWLSFYLSSLPKSLKFSSPILITSLLISFHCCFLCLVLLLLSRTNEPHGVIWNLNLQV